jgi:hypothetical protein
MSHWQTCCAYCYIAENPGGPRLLSCARCARRLYCSPECQHADWKQGHKYYCGKAGERNFDFELGETDERGVGMFALKEIQRGDKIFIERLIDRKEAASTHSIREALTLLQPKHSTDLNQVFRINSIGLHECMGITSADEEVEAEEAEFKFLCMTLARVNHDCIGNASYQYIKELNAVLLVASTTIYAQQEITFSYIDQITSPAQYYRLRGQWDFDCKCECCQSQTIKDNLMEVSNLLSEMKCLGRNPFIITKGARMLQVLEALQLPYCLYARTYYRMFTCAVASPNTLKDALNYISQAVRYCILFFGDISLAELKVYMRYMQNPQSHPNYLCDAAANSATVVEEGR